MATENLCESLGIYRGMPLELDIGDGERYLAQIADFGENEVWISAGTGDNLPAAEEQKSIAIKGRTTGSDVFALSGVVVEIGATFLRVGRLRIHNEANRRDSYRQTMRGEATVMFLRGKNSYNHIRNMPCQIIDISVGGVRIRSKSNYEVNDELQLMNFRIASQELYTFKCSVQWKKEGITGNTYGCQFYGLTSKMEDDLYREIRQAEAQEIRRRRQLED